MTEEEKQERRRQERMKQHARGWRKAWYPTGRGRPPKGVVYKRPPKPPRKLPPPMIIPHTCVVPPEYILKDEAGGYICVLCGAGSTDLHQAHVHLAVRHPREDELVRNSVEQFPRWYYLVWTTQHKHPLDKRNVRIYTRWGAVEMWEGEAEKLVEKVALQPLGAAILQRQFRRIWEGTAKWRQPFREGTGLQWSLEKGYSLAQWVEKRLGMRKWVVVAGLEVWQWMVGMVKEAPRDPTGGSGQD